MDRRSSGHTCAIGSFLSFSRVIIPDAIKVINLKHVQSFIELQLIILDYINKLLMINGYNFCDTNLRHNLYKILLQHKVAQKLHNTAATLQQHSMLQQYCCKFYAV